MPARFRCGQQFEQVSRNAVHSSGEHAPVQAGQAAPKKALAAITDRQPDAHPAASSLLIERLHDRLFPETPGRPDHRIVEPVHGSIPRQQRAIHALSSG
jgi:hypothetical protein